MLNMAVVPRPKSGMNNAAHRGLEAATVTKLVTLVANASLEKSRNFTILSDSSYVHR